MSKKDKALFGLSRKKQTRLMDSESGKQFESSAEEVPKGSCSVLIVDAEKLVRQAIKRLLNSIGGFHVVGEESSAAAALAGLDASKTRHNPNRARPSRPSGIEILLELRRRHSNIASVVLTRLESEKIVEQALLAGASRRSAQDFDDRRPTQRPKCSLEKRKLLFGRRRKNSRKNRGPEKPGRTAAKATIRSILSARAKEKFFTCSPTAAELDHRQKAIYQPENRGNPPSEGGAQARPALKRRTDKIRDKTRISCGLNTTFTRSI